MKFIAVTIALILAIYLGYKWFYPTYSWHQKITVEVETPDGLKTGSSVTSVSWTKGGNWNIGWNWKLNGEAVVVDLGDGEFLFALLKSPYSSYFMGIVAPAAFSKQEESLERLNRRTEALNMELLGEVAGKRGRASHVIELPEYMYPLLVTFSNIDDPASVKKVEPYDFEKHFDKGVRLKRITLEITDESVTKGKIGKLLTWLGEYPEPKLGPATGGSLANAPFNRHVHYGDFRRKF